ncbi:MAG: Rap1a/Tai family immunity protein [Methylohalobius sp.]
MGIRSVSLAMLLVGTAAADYFDGNSLRQLAGSVNPANVAMFRGYVAGLQDANNGAVFCVNPNVRLNQAAAVVKKYLADHPQSWHLPAHQLVIQALSRAFPCGK